MKSEVEEGRRLAQAIARRRTPSSALPEDVRRYAIAYLRRRLGQGASQAVVARELAVTTMTVSRWLTMSKVPTQTPVPAVASTTRAPKATARRSPKLRRVRVVASSGATSSGLVVIMSTGLRIEGLTLSDAIALIRAVG